MPSDHLTSKKTKGTREVKPHPQRCRAAHAVLAQLFQSMQVFFRTICTGKRCQVFPHPHHSLGTLGLYSYWLCDTPGSQGAFPFHHPMWHWILLCTGHFRRADRREDTWLSHCCAPAVDECITTHPP